VQRVARDALVELVDGAGRRARGRLVDATPLAVVEVHELLPDRPQPGRVLVLGRPRGPALEEAVTLAVEVGVSECLVVDADRSPPGSLRADRLDRVVRAAMTQSGSGSPLVLVGPMTLAAALARPLPARRHVAVPGARPAPATEEPAAVAIGPEGGWSPEEGARLAAAGFTPMGLGPWIQRTPTAVAAAIGQLWPG